MTHSELVLTLIAPPGSILKPEALVSPADVGPIAHVEWLEEDLAADVFLRVPLNDSALTELRKRSENARVDVVIQPTKDREKRLLISDMDSTMIQQECIDEMARIVGKYDVVKAITASTMGSVNSDFTSSLRTRLGMIAGVTLQQMQHIFDTVIEPMPGAKTLLATMKARGASTHLVSGGFTFFSEKVARTLGFDTHDSNMLEIQNGAITGNVIGDIVDKEKKKALLLYYAAQHNLPLSATLAVGDGSNDVPMMQAAGLGIAYHASDNVRAQASASIRFNDLSALLYVQGIAKREWITT